MANTNYISQLSDGTSTYIIKDSEARTSLSSKQDSLVNGINIKTVNNESILGSGNISISSGSTYTAGSGINISNNTISVTSPTIINIATGSNSIMVGSLSSGQTANYVNSINLGYEACSRDNAVAIGYNAEAYQNCTCVGYAARGNGTYYTSIGYRANYGVYWKNYPIGIGYQAKANADGAIQIGQGENTEAGTVCFGLTTDGTSWTNYKLLGSDGTIPNARINMDTTPTQNSTNAITSGAVYTVLGDLESAINTIRGV